MSAAARLRAERSALLEGWIRRVRVEVPAAREQTGSVLFDTLPQFIDGLVESLEKSSSESRETLQAAQLHARQRSMLPGYDIEQLLEEYRILRQEIFERLDATGPLTRRERNGILDHVQRAQAVAARRYAEHALSRQEQAALTLRQTEERLQLALESAGMGVWDWDLATGRLHWSERLQSLWGYAPREFAGHIDAFRARVHPEDRPAVDRALASATPEHPDYQAEFRVVRPGEIEHWVLARGRLRLDPAGRPHRITGVATEITERKRAEARLLSTLAELREEQELRERFFRTLTHDLRTPITAARMHCDLVHRTAAMSPERVAGHADAAVAALDRVDRMIEELLDVSRIHAGRGLRLEIEELDLAELVRATARELTATFGLDFRVEAPESLQGWWAGAELRRALENLGSNAAKYGDPTRPVTLRLRDGDDQVELSVHNEGDPIPATDLPRLFDPFMRAESAERRARGWGLGLSVVQSVVDAHRGKVSVRSAAGAGTTFSLLLPRDARKALGNTDPREINLD